MGLSIDWWSHCHSDPHSLCSCQSRITSSSTALHLLDISLSIFIPPIFNLHSADHLNACFLFQLSSCWVFVFQFIHRLVSISSWKSQNEPEKFLFSTWTGLNLSRTEINKPFSCGKLEMPTSSHLIFLRLNWSGTIWWESFPLSLGRWKQDADRKSISMNSSCLTSFCFSKSLSCFKRNSLIGLWIYATYISKLVTSVRSTNRRRFIYIWLQSRLSAYLTLALANRQIFAAEFNLVKMIHCIIYWIYFIRLFVLVLSWSRVIQWILHQMIILSVLHILTE